MPRPFAITLLAPLFLAALATAQQIDVVSGTLTVGQTIDIGFHDPSRANQTVTLTVDNGDPNDPEKVEVDVKLDAHGNGSTSFEVPDWWCLHVNGGGAKEVTRVVEEPQSRQKAVSHPAVD
ncbi:MAG: hypothetical protein U1F60_14260 [Planctomycetota bacterium]